MKSLRFSIIYVIRLFFFLTIFFLSCKSKKQIQKSKEEKVIITEQQNFPDSIDSKCRIDFKNAKTISALLSENEFSYTSMTAKYEVKYENGNDNFDCDIEVRTIKDSVIWINLTYILGVNVARIYITKDSVKLVQHLPSKRYFKGDYGYLSKLLQTELDFEILQALFSGNSARFYEDDGRLKPGRDRDSCLYTLSTIKKRFIKSVVTGNEQFDEPAQILWITPDTYKVKQNTFIDARSLRKFKIQYNNFNSISDKLYPFLANVVIEPNGYQKIFVNIECKKIETGKALSFPFNIPSKYEPIIKE